MIPFLIASGAVILAGTTVAMIRLAHAANETMDDLL